MNKAISVMHLISGNYKNCKSIDFNSLAAKFLGNCEVVYMRRK